MNSCELLCLSFGKLEVLPVDIQLVEFLMDLDYLIVSQAEGLAIDQGLHELKLVYD